MRWRTAVRAAPLVWYTPGAVKTVEWHEPAAPGGAEVRLIDQTRLPLEEVVVRCRDYRQVAEAIRSMQVRGAPAIGVTAAMGMALASNPGGCGAMPTMGTASPHARRGADTRTSSRRF